MKFACDEVRRNLSATSRIGAAVRRHGTPGKRECHLYIEPCSYAGSGSSSSDRRRRAVTGYRCRSSLGGRSAPRFASACASAHFAEVFGVISEVSRGTSESEHESRAPRVRRNRPPRATAHFAEVFGVSSDTNICTYTYMCIVCTHCSKMRFLLPLIVEEFHNSHMHSITISMT